MSEIGLYAAIRAAGRAFSSNLVEKRPDPPEEHIEESIYVRVEHLEAEWLKYRLNLEGIVEEMEGLFEKISRKRAQTAAAVARLAPGAGPNGIENPGSQTREAMLADIRRKTGVLT